MSRVGSTAILACFGLCNAEESSSPGELLLLQQISRHGARSKKTKYPGECPNDPVLYQWDSWNAELSGPGMLQEAAIGTVTRQIYGEWLGPYNGSRMMVRSCDSPRVLQSAEVTLASLFPPGTGPDQGLPGRPTFVPIHTLPEEEDNLLTPEDAACKDRNEADYEMWWESTGAGIFEAGHAASAPVTEFCGKAATSNKVFKHQVDGIGFDLEGGFALNGITDDVLLAAQNLTITLQRGDFATDEARTYLAGEMPSTLLKNMDQAVADDGQGLKYMLYFSHRHSLYALAEFLGWSWTLHGLPEGMVHTGTTLWMELRRGEEAGQYEVTFLQWAPHCEDDGCDDDGCEEACRPQPVLLPGCTKRNGMTCSLEEFRAIVSQRIARTGTFQELCEAELMV